MADDATLETILRLRALCLALPGAEEKDATSEPSFRVGGRVFAICKGAGRSMWCRAPEGRQRELMASEPGRYFVPPYLAHEGWVGIHLEGADWDAVARHVHASYGLVAPPPSGEDLQAPHSGRIRRAAYPWALAARASEGGSRLPRPDPRATAGDA